MIPDSLAPGIVIRAHDKTSAKESGDEARGSEVRNKNAADSHMPYTVNVAG